VLLDAGTGARRLVTDPDLLRGIGSIDVLLSHFHLDHVIGLSYLSRLSQSHPVTIHGPGAWLYEASTASILDSLLSPPFQPRSLKESGMQVAELRPSGLSIGNSIVTARHQTLHTSASAAFRVDDALAYCSDTGFDDGNIAFAQGCALLAHEAWLPGAVGADGHSSVVEAAQVARQAQVARLLLTHLAPDADPTRLELEARTVFEQTTAASDLLVLDL
jgi:ribonuclease BN (tRNA processing enzyme)